MADKKISTREMIAAIKSGRGNLSAAARILGCSRHTLVRYANRYPSVADACQQALEEEIDRVKSKLMEQVEQGSIKAISFYLKNLGMRKDWLESSQGAEKDDNTFNNKEWEKRCAERLKAAVKSLHDQQLRQEDMVMGGNSIHRYQKPQGPDGG